MTRPAGPPAAGAPGPPGNVLVHTTLESPSRSDAPFRVEVHDGEDPVRVAPVGELDLATGGELEARLSELLEAGVRDVVLDLRELRFIDSAGIRLILVADKAARAEGRGFAVISGPPVVQRVLEISGLISHLRFLGA